MPSHENAVISLNSNVLSSIRNKSLFSIVPDLEELAIEQGELATYSKGSVICSPGDSMDWLIIPTAGLIALQRNFPDGMLHHLHEGRALALKYLLDGEETPYGAAAVAETTVLRIPKKSFLQHLAAHPSTMHYLRLMTHSAGARSLKRHLVELRTPLDLIKKVFSHFGEETQRIGKGEEVLLNGENFYLLDNGMLSLSWSEGRGTEIRQLGEGTCFGGQKLVTPSKPLYKLQVESVATVRRAELRQLLRCGLSSMTIDSLASEPWIQTSPPTKYIFWDGNKLEAFPGTPLKSIRIKGRDYNDSQFQQTSDAFQSVKVALSHLSFLTKININLANIDVDLEHCSRVSPLRLAQWLEPQGVIVQQNKMTYKELKCSQLPLLCMCLDRLTVVAKCERRHVTLVDPLQGILRISRNDFCRFWDGKVIQISKVDPTDSSVRSFLGKPFVDLFSLPLNRLLLAITGLIISFIVPRVTQAIVDTAVGGLATHPIYPLLGVLFFFSFYSMLMTFFDNLLQLHFTQGIEKRTAPAFCRQTFLGYSFPPVMASGGDIQSNFDQLESIRTFLSTAGPGVLMSFITLAVSGLLLVYYQWNLSFIALSAVPVLCLVEIFYRPRCRENYERLFHKQRNLNRVAAAHLTAMADIKIFGTESLICEMWESAIVKAIALKRKIFLQGLNAGSFVGIYTGAVQLALLFCSYRMALRHQITFGAIFAIQAYSQNMLQAVHSLASTFGRLEELKVAAEKVSKILSLRGEQSAKKAKTRFSVTLRSRIALDSLSFRYSKESHWILKDLSANLYFGQSVAIVGKSGCGKSTLAQLLAGLRPPSTGRIFIDDLEIRELSTHCLRNQIVLVPQDNFLFQGTVAENISLGDDCPMEAEIVRAAKDAGAADFINELPGNYSYFLNEGGIGLSAGQRQRIALARALYKNPKVLILDEATSYLDPELETVVSQSIRARLRDGILINITHRLSLALSADRIFALDNSKFIEVGDPESLLRKGDLYFNLLKDQLAHPNQTRNAA